MSKTIAVIGATGAQGGSVARKFFQDKSWKVRTITRNVNSNAAKSLGSSGAEIVGADLDDEGSLIKAFEGATAIFGVTNFWEPMFSKSLSAEECMNIEYGQACALANAAAETPTLEHYIWSTIPNSEAVSNGKVKVYHFDGKAKADDYIREKLPGLAAKTTFLWVGYYPSNMAYFPMLMATPMVSISFSSFTDRCHRRKIQRKLIQYIDLAHPSAIPLPAIYTRRNNHAQRRRRNHQRWPLRLRHHRPAAPLSPG